MLCLSMTASAVMPGLPARIALSADEVHVWRVSYARLAAHADEIASVLDQAERARAARYRFAADRRRCTISRGVLRRLLAACCGVAPAAIGFSYGPYGKPALEEPAADVSFNIAHSGDVGLFALTRSRDLGIDVERCRAEAATFAIAERFFAAAEVSALRALPAERRTAAFFRCWTLKEAFVKARGLGLSLALDRFVVALAPEEPAALLALDGDPVAAASWRLAALPAPAGYAAALAVAGDGWRLSLHDWPA
jgi:4'-phosphopantetheinyl transferase